jgi:hypothetical protein
VVTVEANKRAIVGGWPTPGSFLALCILQIYKTYQAYWREPLLPFYPQIDFRSTLDPLTVRLHSLVLSPFETAADGLLAWPMAVIPGLGTVAAGVGDIAFAPAAYALPLTLVWLCCANPTVPVGVWLGSASGVATEALLTRFVMLMSLAANTDSGDITVPTAGLNGSLTFVVVYYFYFQTHIMFPGRRSVRGLAVATVVAGTAGGLTQILPGTWPSAVVLLITQYVDKMVICLWSVGTTHKRMA